MRAKRAQAWLAENTWTPRRLPAPWQRPSMPYLSALMIVAVADGLTFLVERHLPHFAFHGMLGFVALLCVSMVWGAGPGSLGAVLNAVVLSFVVMPPGQLGPPALVSALVSSLLSLCFGVLVAVLASLSESRRRQLAGEHSERERLLVQAEVALHRLQAVQAVTDTALTHLPAQDLLRQLVTRVAQALSVDNAALLLVTEDGNSLVVYLAYGSEAEREGDLVVPIGQGIAGRIAASRRPLIVTDASNADVSNVQISAMARSLAGVPVMVQDHLLGVLHVDSTVARRFTTEDIEVLQLVAERIALVIENARLFSVEQQRSADLIAERDRLQRVLDVLPEAVVLFDASSRILAMNPVAEALFGMNIAGEKRADLDFAVGLPDGTPVSADDLPYRRSLTAGETSRGVRLVIRNTAAGEDVTTLTSSAPLRDADGAIAGAVAVFQNISHIVSLEQERDRMLGTVAHDLRNPLTTISGMSQVLLMRVEQVAAPARDRFARSLHTIEAATQRMTRLVDELLDSAQVQAGRPLTLSLELTDVVSLVRRVLEEHQQATDRHTLVLSAHDDPLMALVDPQRLQRVLTNLVGNAVKYSPEGGAIAVSVARAVGPDGEWLSISVADNGIGIPAADLPHMFEQYYRASNVAEAIPGTGIGLADVRHVAERHGGTVTLESGEGQGTTVTLRLPLRRAIEAAAGSVG